MFGKNEELKGDGIENVNDDDQQAYDIARASNTS
jgi:hypothetical protein